MEKERLKFCIERFDQYYDNINNKSNIFLGLSIFIIGSLVTGYQKLMSIVCPNLTIQVLYLLILCIAIVCALLMILASTPYLSKETNSVYYFGSISKMNNGDFMVKSYSLSNEDDLDDLRLQTHSLATGLKRKFKRLRLASMLIALQILLCIPLIILIICNLKQ